MEFDIKRINQPDLTYRVNAIIGKFDLQNEKFIQEFKGKIDLDGDWNIGLIVGNSGTGKSTIIKELFNENITNFNYTKKSVIDDMPENKTTDEIVKMFNSVGFSSPTSWLKPYQVLSNGEKMRVDLANSLLTDNNITVFDEFTSVVDRNVAKIGSIATAKAVRKLNKKFIAVGCHFDVEDWLQPDWVFNTNNMEFYKIKKKSLKLDMNYGKLWINQYGKCLKTTII